MKISEIMDNYIDDEISIQCNELVSSERIKELTMKKISDQKLLKSKPFKMSTRLILAAAMVLVLGCGTVIAAVNKNAIEEYFQKYILGRELNDDEGVILSEISTEFSDKSGKQITVSSNGTDVTALSMLFDGHQFYIKLRITAPEGVVFPEEGDMYYQLSNWSVDAFPGYKGSYSEGDVYEKVVHNSENEIEIIRYYVLDSNEIDGADKAPVPESFHFEGVWLQDKEKNYTEILTGSFDIPIAEYTNINYVIVYSDVYGKVDISQLSCYVENAAEISEKEAESQNSDPRVYLVMTDGSEIHAGENGIWETIVDTTQIKEVHIGSEVFDINE